MPANSSAARCTLDPVPVEAKVSLPGSLLRQRDQFGDRTRRHRRMHQHDIAARCDQSDRREILARVVADIGIERRVDRERARGDQERVAVGLGLGDLARRDGAAGAAAVLDHDGLAEARAHPLGDDARDHVVAAAGRVGHDQRDRTGRIVRRLRAATPARNAARDSGRAQQRRSFRLGAGLLHDGGPLGLFLVDVGGVFLGRRGERLGAVGGQRSLVSADVTASRSAALSLSTIGLRRAGRRDDAVMQHRLEARQAASATVGRSGNTGERFGPVTASARTLPSLAMPMAGRHREK